MRDLLIPSFLVSDVSESLVSLTKNERCERIDQVDHQKRTTMSESFRWLTKNERMSESLIFFSKSLIRWFFRKKTSDPLRKPLSEFPALILDHWRSSAYLFLLITFFVETSPQLIMLPARERKKLYFPRNYLLTRTYPIGWVDYWLFCEVWYSGKFSRLSF